MQRSFTERRCNPEWDFVELPHVITAHCHGLALCRVIGADFHFACYANQIVSGGSDVERAINIKLSMPITGVTEALPCILRLLPQGAAHEVAERSRILLA